MREELDYKASDQADTAAAMYKRMNDGQMRVFDAVITMVRASENDAFSVPHMIFNDAPGRSGKTFVNEALCAKVRGECKIVLAVASSGIVGMRMRQSTDLCVTFRSRGRSVRWNSYVVYWRFLADIAGCPVRI